MPPVLLGPIFPCGSCPPGRRVGGAARREVGRGLRRRSRHAPQRERGLTGSHGLRQAVAPGSPGYAWHRPHARGDQKGERTPNITSTPEATASMNHGAGLCRTRLARGILPSHQPHTSPPPPPPPPHIPL